MAGFWGGLVPEYAHNATVLEDLLDAGALGLKVETIFLSFMPCFQVKLCALPNF